MSRQSEHMWATLLRADIVRGAAPKAGKLESPWYVKSLLALSGWIAAIFLLGFIGVGLSFVFEDSTITLITGGILISSAFAILRVPKNEFIEHLALTVSLAGQALVVFSIFESFDGLGSNNWLLLALLETALAVVMPNFVHRVFSSFIAAFAFSMTLNSHGWSFATGGIVMFFTAWCWLNEFQYPEHMRKIQAIGYGLVLALIQLHGTEIYGYRTIDWLFDHNQPVIWAKPWMSEVLIGAVTLYVVWNVLRRYGQPFSGRLSTMALLAAFLVCILSVKVHGVTVGMVILLLGFAGAHRILLGLGLVSLLFYISSYYYLLNATLLAKSRTLFVVGLALLILRWLMLRLVSVRKEGNHV